MIFQVPKHRHFCGYDSVIKDTLHHLAHMQYHSWISDGLKPPNPPFFFNSQNSSYLLLTFCSCSLTHTYHNRFRKNPLIPTFVFSGEGDLFHHGQDLSSWISKEEKFKIAVFRCGILEASFKNTEQNRKLPKQRRSKKHQDQDQKNSLFYTCKEFLSILMNFYFS